MATVKTRSTHPETSFWAADKLEQYGSMTFIKSAIIEILKDHPAGLSDEQIRFMYETRSANDLHSGIGAWPKLAESTLRARRSELVREGIVEHTGKYEINENDNKCRTWRIAGRPLRR